MKKSLFLAAALLGFATTASAYTGWGLYGTYWNADDAGSDAGAGFRLSIEMVSEVQLELRAAYYGDMGDETKIEVVPLEAGLMLSQAYNSKISFTGGGGVGYYQADVKLRAPDRGSSSENEIGFWIAGGLEYALKQNAALFVEAKYTFVSIDQGGAGLADADLDGPGINAGLLVRW